MNKSLLHRLMELESRVKALEAKPATAPVMQDIDALLADMRKSLQEPKSDRKMCPHCGVKPNHFFHVRTCAEKNKNNGQNPDRRRDQGAT